MTLRSWISLGLAALVSGCVAGQVDEDGLEDSLDSALTAGAGIKWHPGHYVRINGDGSSDGACTKVLANQYTKGVTVEFDWQELEIDKDRYDFSAIDKYVKLAAAKHKYVNLKIQDRCFGCKTAPVPDYLLSAAYHGGVATMSNGSTARIWDPVVNDRFIALYRKLGAKYNSSSVLASVTIGDGESAIAIDKPNTPGYSAQIYANEIVRVATEVHKAFPNTIVYTGMNFIENREDGLRPIAQKLVALGGNGIVHPDTEDDSTPVPVYAIEREFKNILAIQPSVQSPAITVGMTEEEIYLFAKNSLGANFITWDAWFTPRSGEQRPNYVTDYVLPVVNKYKGATNTKCPSSFAKSGGCI